MALAHCLVLAASAAAVAAQLQAPVGRGLKEESSDEAIRIDLANARYQPTNTGLGPQISTKEIPAPGDFTPLDEGQELELSKQPVVASTPLLVLGIALAITSFFAASVLVLMLVAAVAGLSVPLLATLPAASSALFVVQLLALEGSKESAPPPLKDLARPLAWVAPGQPDSVLFGCILVLCAVWLARRVAARRHRQSVDGSDRKGALDRDLPHSLTPGAWELRALGLLAFPLSAASTELMLNLHHADSPLAGFLVAAVILCFLANQALLALNFVREVLREGRVLRAPLPAAAGGHEVFVDRVCNELRALPVCSSRPGALFGDWLATPGWCISSAVAAIQEIEIPDQVFQAGSSGVTERSAGAWCSGEGAREEAWEEAAQKEDELQDRPLLNSSEEEKIADEDRDLEASRVGGSSSSRATADSKDEDAVPQLVFVGRASAVKISHPVAVTTAVCYEVQARDAVAGVTCIPWLDCAVPANVLRRIEELCGDVMLRVHPGQLTGELSGGQYSACFDWGTSSPWRWPVELAAKTLFGAWAAIPRTGQEALLSPAWAFVVDYLMVLIAAIFAIFMVKVKGFEHWNDNTALWTAYLAAVNIVSIRASWNPTNIDFEHGPLSTLQAAAAAMLALIPCMFALLAGVSLVGTALVRLEAQGLQDHLLPQTVTGWSSRGSRTGAGGDGRSPGICDATQGSSQDGRDVEVIMPGVRKAFAILLPARSRLRIKHAQLLPPVAGRGGEPQTLPPCAATGDRARLPIPPRFLFPAAPNGSTREGGASLEAPSAPPGVVPLAAVVAPGRLGRLIYSEASHNEAGASWQEVLASFFGMNGSLLADEAERIVSEAKAEAGHAPCPLVVLEVLPALASEFMDDRDAPREVE